MKELHTFLWYLNRQSCSLSLSLSHTRTDFFSLLANVNGAVERDGILYFCRVTRKLASAMQERLFSQYQSLDKVFQECLEFVRSAEDIEDEELDGGIKRPWLSQFEFTKLFTAMPEPKVLSWFALWHQLPAMEKGECGTQAY